MEEESENGRTTQSRYIQDESCGPRNTKKRYVTLNGANVRASAVVRPADKTAATLCRDDIRTREPKLRRLRLLIAMSKQLRQ